MLIVWRMPNVRALPADFSHDRPDDQSKYFTECLGDLHFENGAGAVLAERRGAAHFSALINIEMGSHMRRTLVTGGPLTSLPVLTNECSPRYHRGPLLKPLESRLICYF